MGTGQQNSGGDNIPQNMGGFVGTGQQNTGDNFIQNISQIMRGFMGTNGQNNTDENKNKMDD